ncbi:casein kinase II [Cryptosporidium ryanae]|uniref:casein kinase II n=1 Tax=Cryptosporidium ryanae TaxID=515981 RepID=UPI00351A4F6F|nr:casein kinase II [Cryptosporidium ryanae]
MASKKNGTEELPGTRECSSAIQRARAGLRVQRLAEAFEIGSSIEIFNDSSRESLSDKAEFNMEESGRDATEDRREDFVFVFGILEHLGVGSCGIVVLADSRVESRGPETRLETESLICRKRSSVKAEVSGFHVRRLMEMGERSRNLRESGSLVAIKIVDLEEGDSLAGEDPVALAGREVKLMSELQDCSEILEYYVTFTSGSYLFIVMEYCKGGSLYGMYNRYGSFPEELIALVVSDVVKALKRLHYGSGSEYVVHNDIKSANILVSDRCKAKLADFGISRKVYLDGRGDRMRDNLLHDLSGKGEELLGSPFWMAPEVILGQDHTQKTDVWSLGITVLELAFGRIPWPAFSTLEDLLSHILRSPPPHKGIREEVKGLFSQEFWDFVDSCLQTDPQKRASSASLLRHPFLRNKHFVHPTSLEEFRSIILGKKLTQRQNVVRSPYVEGILDYFNVFSDRSGVLSRSISNVRKKKSISVNRYFSRKRSDKDENGETESEASILDRPEIPVPRHSSLGKADHKRNTLPDIMSDSQACCSPNSILERRISAKWVKERFGSSLPSQNQLKSPFGEKVSRSDGGRESALKGRDSECESEGFAEGQMSVVALKNRRNASLSGCDSGDDERLLPKGRFECGIMKTAFGSLALVLAVCSLNSIFTAPPESSGDDNIPYPSLQEIVSSFNGNSCYIKGESVGSGKYSNVYLSWRVDHCPLVDFEGMEGTIFIDPTKESVSDQEISLLKGVPVAIKELKSVNEWKIAREVAILSQLNGHYGRDDGYTKGRSSIIRLLDVISYPNAQVRSNVKGKRSFALVMEYVRNEQFYSLLPRLKYGDVQNYMRQLIEGIEYANSLGIFHRDIKPQNVIINERKKELKIIDWGLAEYYVEEAEYSPRVASKHYKAPELLLGLRNYDYTLDTWSIGCLFSQMIFRLGTSKSNYFSRMFATHPKRFVGVYSEDSPHPDVLFPGWDNEDQIVKIGSLLGGDNILAVSRKYNGTVPEAIMGNLLRTRKIYNATKPWYTDPRTFYFLVNKENTDLVTLEALDLLSKMLTLDYRYRIGPGEALKHPFFTKKYGDHAMLSARGRKRGVERYRDYMGESYAKSVGHCNLNPPPTVFSCSGNVNSHRRDGSGSLREI